MEEAASDKLLIASAVIETLPDKIPTISLKIKSKMLQKMPTALPRKQYF